MTDIIIIAILAVLVSIAAVCVIRRKGRCSCCNGDCEHCKKR